MPNDPLRQDELAFYSGILREFDAQIQDEANLIIRQHLQAAFRHIALAVAEIQKDTEIPKAS